MKLEKSDSNFKLFKCKTKKINFKIDLGLMPVSILTFEAFILYEISFSILS